MRGLLLKVHLSHLLAPGFGDDHYTAHPKPQARTFAAECKARTECSYKAQGQHDNKVPRGYERASPSSLVAIGVMLETIHGSFD